MVQPRTRKAQERAQKKAQKKALGSGWADLSPRIEGSQGVVTVRVELRLQRFQSRQSLSLLSLPSLQLGGAQGAKSWYARTRTILPYRAVREGE